MKKVRVIKARAPEDRGRPLPEVLDSPPEVGDMVERIYENGAIELFQYNTHLIEEED